MTPLSALENNGKNCYNRRYLKLGRIGIVKENRCLCRLAWKEQFGSFSTEEMVELQTATQQVVEGTVCGPDKIKVEGFRSVYNEVLFLDMDPDSGEYEPLLGYIVLEQCGAAVDMVGHRLIPVKYMDLKGVRRLLVVCQLTIDGYSRLRLIRKSWSYR